MRPRALLLALALVGPTEIAHVDEFIDAPHGLFGRTRVQVERALGKPVAVQTLPGTVEEWAYPGVVVRIDGAGALRRVEITDPRQGLPWGLTIGAPRSRVEELLGEPQEMTDARYLYLYSDGFPNTVEFFFRDNRVHRITWSYWVK